MMARAQRFARFSGYSLFGVAKHLYMLVDTSENFSANARGHSSQEKEHCYLFLVLIRLLAGHSSALTSR